MSFLERLKKKSEPNPKTEEEGEYIVPTLNAVPKKMTMELLCRRREEELRKRYGVKKDKDGTVE